MLREFLRIHETAYPYLSHGEIALTSSDKQLQIHSIAAENGNPSAIAMAVCHSVNDYQWKVWTVTASDTEVTSTIQADSAISMFPTLIITV